MSLIKTTWLGLMNQSGKASIITSIASLKNSVINDIETKINAKYGNSLSITPMKNLLAFVTDSIMTTLSTGMWANLPIYVSSYKVNDNRILYNIQNKLREYAMFYYTILNDDGVARRLSYAKQYGNRGSSSSAERSTASETPQNSSLYDSTHPESDALFDQAIADYASSIGKNKAETTSSSSGNSTTIVSGVTWEEQKKNLDLLFYNVLCDYISSIPERVYSYYAIDTVPFTELTVEYFKYLDTLKDMLQNE